MSASGTPVEHNDGFHGQIHQYVSDRASRCSERGLLQLFGSRVRSWADLGTEHGRLGQDVSSTLSSIRHVFDSGFEAEQRQHAQTRVGQTAIARKQQDRRTRELEMLERQARACEAAADEENPNSEISKEVRYLDHFRDQRDIVMGQCQLASAEDVRAECAKRANTVRRQYLDRMEKETFEHQASMMAAYRQRTGAALSRLGKLREELVTLKPPNTTLDEHEDIAYHDRVEALQAEIAAQEQELVDMPELRAVEGAMKLRTFGPPQMEEVPADSRPPKWWRINLVSYRRLLWMSLIVAICGDQLVMQQLTGGFLGIRTMVQIFSQDLPEHFALLRQSADLPGILNALIALGSDLMWGVLAFAFGLIPLLLSLPLRRVLEEDEQGGSRKFVTWVFLGTIVLFLTTLAGATYFDQMIGGNILTPNGSTGWESLQNACRALALPSLTLVLILGTAWITHLLFPDKARAHFVAYLGGPELDRLQRRMDETRARIEQFRRRAVIARQEVLAAEHRHASEDALAAAMEFDVGTLRLAFERMKDATVSAYVSGYDTGRQIREQGIDLRSEAGDKRSVAEYAAHRSRIKLMDAVARLGGANGTDTTNGANGTPPDAGKKGTTGSGRATRTHP